MRLSSSRDTEQQIKTDSLAGSPTDPSPSVSGSVPFAFWLIVLARGSEKKKKDKKTEMGKKAGYSSGAAR